MPNVDLRVGDIQWPAKCCRCGSDRFTYRSRTEKVVTRSVLAATEYRRITLHDVPVCNRCEIARYYWFGGAIAVAALGFLVADLAGKDGTRLYLDIGLFIAAVVMAVIGTTKSPVRILNFVEATNTLRVQIYHHGVAAEMAQREQQRTDLAGHAEYLAEQAEKQRQRDREVLRTFRVICGGGFAIGLYFVIAMGIKPGYVMMALSSLVWAPFEWKALRRRRQQGGDRQARRG